MKNKLLLMVLPISIISLISLGIHVDPDPITNIYGLLVAGNLCLHVSILGYILFY